MALLGAVERTLRRHAMLAGGETVLVAVSGGADSVALLHLLRTLAPAWRLALHVLHVDHQLRPDSAADARFVRDLGARLGVPVEVATVEVATRGSLEAAARQARYAALDACADRIGADRIAVGHTADDQAETVLMRLIEGTGARGLAGIPPVRGRVIRPLLECRRAVLVEELGRAGLPWVEDETNRDPKFLRNRIRHELLPLLAGSYSPGIAGALARAAARVREAVEALERVAARELERLSVVGDAAVILPLGELRALPRQVAAEVLRQAAGRLGSKAPLRAWAHRGLRRVLVEPDHLPPTLTIRPRRPGDRLEPFGGCSRKVKDLLIDAKVPRWERGRVPVVEAAGKILWLGGVRRGAAAPVTARTRRVLELALSPLAEPRAAR